MRRATIIADVNEPGEAKAAEAWLAAAEGRLTHVSDQLGCGCCVLIWDIEGPDEVIATLPESLRGYSAWDPFPLPEKTGLLSRLCRFLRR
ncbi:hypothetical protein [Roseococcus pinisoli]|uniref:Uncharacterized protein n=1 Tax=Roseococcus pinisoli TaxID=2835040 RepID=A0ABS5QC96_9PROT|nr:hypothetical protein [Roseococcus pinisoli]MBS7811304.1 hypothetical protein [Roseococcus pinisoli]